MTDKDDYAVGDAVEVKMMMIDGKNIGELWANATVAAVYEHQIGVLTVDDKRMAIGRSTGNIRHKVKK